VAAIAARRLGDVEQSDQLARDYAASIESALGPAPERLNQFLLGEMALVDGRELEAIRHLNEAESMLPPRGTESLHALIWYSLATAHRRAGNLGEATSWYERIVGSPGERLFEPIRYVRSYYFLAQLHEADGDLVAARTDYERFLAHWEHGSLDRDRVREARDKLATLPR
jgi:tetratricopeptide (TPR) repeat protein